MGGIVRIIGGFRQGPAGRPGGASIRSYLEGILRDEAKAELLMRVMEEVRVGKGATLFHKGDPDDGLYVLVTGVMTALIGELSGYTAEVMSACTKWSPARSAPGWRS